MTKLIAILALLFGLAHPALAIPAPGSLKATAVTPNQIDLSWRDRSTTEKRFDIYRGLVGGPLALIGRADANATTYSDSGLIASTSYTYQVVAVDIAPSATASATAGAPLSVAD